MDSVKGSGRLRYGFISELTAKSVKINLGNLHFRKEVFK
jgi:hypothetical protein